MIELRWLGTVLQYLRMENPLEIGLQDPIWSDWFDVPTEFEVKQPKE